MICPKTSQPGDGKNAAPSLRFVFFVVGSDIYCCRLVARSILQMILVPVLRKIDDAVFRKPSKLRPFPPKIRFRATLERQFARA